MDIEEWELLPDDGFLEIHDDGSGNKIYSRKYVNQPNKSIFQMNSYFDTPPRSSARYDLDPPRKGFVPNQLVPISIPKELDLVVQTPPPAGITTDDMAIKSPVSNQDGVSQVFFKKENEFVDMKMDSPRSTASANNGLMMDFGLGKDGDVINWVKEDENDIDGGFNLWKWSLNGVGAICSFGVAAATICIIVFANHQKNKNQHNQKFRFQIYADDKRIKQVVQQATKLNDAISVARGVPLTRAHITVGGYYDSI